MPSTATDGKKYGTSFDVTLTKPNDPALLTAGKIDQPLVVKGTITPDSQHANKLADVFAVDRMNGKFYMRTLTGAFEAWNGQIKTLKPMKEAVNLGTALTLEIYNGTYSESATHQVYIGYMPAGGTALIYSASPREFSIKAEEISISPLTYFGDKIETPLFQSRCIACHVTGGVAKDSSLLLDRASATSLENNYAVLKELQKTKGTEYILQKPLPAFLTPVACKSMPAVRSTPILRLRSA